MAKEEQAILEGEPVQEELMSCPRRYRADYAKPNGWVDIPYMPILADGVTYESNYVLPPRRKPPIRAFNIKGPAGQYAACSLTVKPRSWRRRRARQSSSTDLPATCDAAAVALSPMPSTAPAVLARCASR